MHSIYDANISKGMRVFVRLDLDVPLRKGTILETYRLDSGLETLRYIIAKGGFPILGGHLGKPEGIITEELSTKQLLPYFEEKLGKDTFLLLDNLRFDKREEENSEEYAKELIKKNGIDIYVNESFATCHREHTSIVALPKLLPAYAGIRLQKEITVLDKLKKDYINPFVVIIGGAKLESKKPVIDIFLEKADYVLIGGKIGLEWNKDIPNNLVLPLDYAKDNKDIGKNTIEKYSEIISKAKTILWAGPMGLYEDKEYIKGTKSIYEAIIKNTNVWSIVGGGDTITALNKFGDINKFSFVSTGGGAMLEYLAKGTLPGIEVLNKHE